MTSWSLSGQAPLPDQGPTIWAPCRSPIGNSRGTSAGVLATGLAADAAYQSSVLEWRVLTAAALVGLAQRAVELAVDYVKLRKQFGVVLGQFQAIAHRLADCATSVDGARLLVREAASCMDQSGGEQSAIVSMAFFFANETAQKTAGESLHFHGGFGFTLESDIQLLYRRAKSWALIGGDPHRVLNTIAESVLQVGPLSARSAPGSSDSIQQQARSFAAQHVTAELVDEANRSGTIHSWELHRALAARGWLAAGWDPTEGGQGWTGIEMMTLLEELHLAGAPLDGWTVTMSAASTIRALGTDEQRRRILPEIVSGRALISIGFSEPDAGSDVAALRTSAIRDGDGWVIDGQKMFTTMAHEARWVFLLVRTNPSASKHRGLTMFMVPLDTPGIEIHPIRTMGGERTNATFYNGVRVEDSARIGEIDHGWDVLLTSLSFERGSAFGATSSFLGTLNRSLRSVVRWAHAVEREEGRAIDDPDVRRRLARIAIDSEVSRLLNYRSIAAAERGEVPDVEAAMAKLFVTESVVRDCADLLDILGAEGLLDYAADDAPGRGEVEHAFRHSVITTIYGGSSEVMRNVISQRGLGLPSPIPHQGSSGP